MAILYPPLSIAVYTFFFTGSLNAKKHKDSTFHGLNLSNGSLVSLNDFNDYLSSLVPGLQSSIHEVVDDATNGGHFKLSNTQFLKSNYQYGDGYYVSEQGGTHFEMMKNVSGKLVATNPESDNPVNQWFFSSIRPLAIVPYRRN